MRSGNPREVVDRIREVFPAEVVYAEDRRVGIAVKAKVIAELAESMRKLGAHLSAITCIDELDSFKLVYHFDIGGCLVNVYTEVSKCAPELDSITGVYPVADFYEREVHEMFGVKFRGHPRLEKLFLPDNWPENSYPLRKR